jgi:CheY-like chemotaxis protein
VQQATACPAHVLLINAATQAALWPAVQQAQGALADTPIIGSVCPARLSYALANGVVAYLTKPLGQAALAEALAKAGRPVGTALVVDDDPGARELMSMTLKAVDERIQVLTAADGAAALALMRNSAPDLLLLDVIMPGMSGWDVLAAKQDDDVLRAVPAIMVTAQDVGEGPVTSPLLLASMHGGVTPSQILRAGLALSQVLLTSNEAGVPIIP